MLDVEGLELARQVAYHENTEEIIRMAGVIRKEAFKVGTIVKFNARGSWHQGYIVGKGPKRFKVKITHLNGEPVEGGHWHVPPVWCQEVKDES